MPGRHVLQALQQALEVGHRAPGAEPPDSGDPSTGYRSARTIPPVVPATRSLRHRTARTPGELVGRQAEPQATVGGREVIEAALAHVVQNKVEAACRSDLLERLRRLMDEWAQYVSEPRGHVMSVTGPGVEERERGSGPLLPKPDPRTADGQAGATIAGLARFLTFNGRTVEPL